MSRNYDGGAGKTRELPQLLALAFGVIYLLVGILGFFITGFSNFVGQTGERLLGLFEVNPLHNLAHLGVGILGIAMSAALASARGYGWILAVAYGGLFLYGIFAAGNPSIDILSLNAADNWLHLATALVGLVIALLPARRAGARV